MNWRIDSMMRTQSLPQAHRTAVGNGRHEIVADAPINKGGGGAHELLEAVLASKQCELRPAP